MLNVFFNESRVFCDIMWKIIAEPDRTRMTMTHAGNLSLKHTHTQNM